MGVTRPLTDIKGVGDVLAQKFQTLGVETIADLIEYFPRRYDDYTQVSQIAHIKPGMVTVQAMIKQVSGCYVRRGMHITEAVAADATGSVRLIWFNQPYRAAAINPNTEYFIRGDFALKSQRLSIQSPSIEVVSDFPVQTARIVPTYKANKSVKSSQIRSAIAKVVPEIRDLSETLPSWILQSQKLMSRAEAVLGVHFPESSEALVDARRRLGFEEVFQLSLAALLNKKEFSKSQGLLIPFKEKQAKTFVAHLPFQLTGAQRKAVWQIYQDMQRSDPMNRLLEGDVGSGKTVVAAMAAVMVLEAGLQVALMAPTELLARQHADSLHRLLKPLGMSDLVLLLVGGMTVRQKKVAHDMISNGSAGLIIGTHALLQEKVSMKKLGLAIIDEQHRFGVEQRKKLQAKAGHMPHILSMTATPIPRSLALTLYGELDVTVLDEKPEGRVPVTTNLVSPNSQQSMLTEVVRQLETGRQVFVVCPVIDQTEDGLGRSVEVVFEEVKTRYSKKYKVGILHGRMKSQEKEAAMAAFVARDVDILVATTVVEVGVDVPNATVMLVESPERFGLAQIHQLRGRVGRGSHQGYCYLLLSDSAAASARLRALESTTDGFVLAEMDLDLRGPGAIYGISQHGLLDLRVAKLSDTKLIAAAKTAAQAFIDKQESLLQYKELQEAVSQLRAVTNLN